MGKGDKIADLEKRLIQAKGDQQQHADVRDAIRADGLPQLTAELDRIADSDEASR